MNNRITTHQRPIMAVTFLVGCSLLAASTAQAIHDPNSDEWVAEWRSRYYYDRDVVRLRGDVQKQFRKANTCLAKAQYRCSRDLDPTTMEGPDPAGYCSVADPNSSVGVAPDTLAKFRARIDKCRERFTIQKKLPDFYTNAEGYVALGCPADDPNGVIDMETYEKWLWDHARQEVEDATAPIAQLCSQAIDPLNGGSAVQVMNCVKYSGKGLIKYTQGLFRCARKCENDHNYKYGWGFLSDDPNLCLYRADQLAAIVCRVKALTKAQRLWEKDPAANSLETFFVFSTFTAIDSFNDDFFNNTPFLSGKCDPLWLFPTPQ